MNINGGMMAEKYLNTLKMEIIQMIKLK